MLKHNFKNAQESKDGRVTKQLETAFEERSGSYGNLFNIQTHRPIQILTLSIHTDVASGVVEVWTCNGNFESYMKDNTLYDWRLVSNTTIEGAGRMKPTLIPIEEFEMVEIEKDMIQGFYVTLQTPDLRYTVMNYENGTPYPSSSDLDILIGSGVRTYPFRGDVLPSRLWNGIVHYSATHHPSSSLMTNFAMNGLTANVILFEVETYQNITITSFDLHLDGYNEDKIGIATMLGPYNPNNKWTSIVPQLTVTSQGRGCITPISFSNFNFVPIEPNQKQTFIITSQNGNLIFEDSTTQPLPHWVLNDDLRLNLGYALNNQYQPIGNATIWNGIIRYYNQEHECRNVHNMLSSPKDHAHTNAYYGIVFDIKPSIAIVLESMQISSSSDTTYVIKTRQGSYLDMTNQFIAFDNSWTILTQGTTMSHTDLHLINLYPSSIPIQADTVQSILIAFSNTTNDLFLLHSHDANLSNDTSVQMSEGKVLNIDGTIDDSLLVYLKGGIYYSTTEQCQVSQEPSNLPTSLPTFMPSIMHSAAPSTTAPSSLTSNTPSFAPTTTAPSTIPSTIPTLSFIPTTSNPTQTILKYATYSPTTTPQLTYTPTTITSPKTNVEVEYKFNILHDSNQESLLKEIDSHITSSLNNLFNELSGNITIFEQINLEIESVTTTFTNNKCSIAKSTSTCSVIHSFLITSYDPNTDITKGMIQYLLYHFASNVQLPLQYQEYVGIQPLFTNPLILLEQEVDTNMQFDTNTTSFYQDTMQEFLNELLPIKVTDVSTSSNIQMLLSNTIHRNTKRSNSLDISTSITGEYQPPPHVDFTNLVQDSIDQHSDALLNKLKKSPTFSNVKTIKSIPQTNTISQTTAMNVTKQSPELPVTETNNTMLVIIITSVVGIVLCLGCACIAITRVMKKNYRAQSPDSNRDSFSKVLNSSQTYMRTSFSNLFNTSVAQTSVYESGRRSSATGALLSGMDYSNNGYDNNDYMYSRRGSYESSNRRGSYASTAH